MKKMKSLCILSLAGSSVLVYYAYDATEWTVRGTEASQRTIAPYAEALQSLTAQMKSL